MTIGLLSSCDMYLHHDDRISDLDVGGAVQRDLALGNHHLSVTCTTMHQKKKSLHMMSHIFLDKNKNPSTDAWPGKNIVM